MVTLPERPYFASVERAERLPFLVRLASGPQDLQRAVEIRASAYSRHLPRVGEVLRTAEKEDLRSDVLLLIAERKFDRRPIGSMRIEPNFTGPLRIEAELALPDRFRQRQLVELTRLGVENGNAGTLVMAALAKAAFEICSARRIDFALAVGRRSMGEMFRSLCFDVIDGPLALTYSKVVPFWLYALPVAEWETRLRERGHFYFEFMARTDHPDITIDYDHVFEAFGMP
jgi:hypothetical protein